MASATASRAAVRAPHYSRRTEEAYLAGIKRYVFFFHARRHPAERGLPWLDGLVRAKRPHRLPVVLTRDEVRAVLERLEGTPRLMAYLLYVAGLRLLECCRLRVQDVDFGANQVIVRGGKGDEEPWLWQTGLVGLAEGERRSIRDLRVCRIPHWAGRLKGDHARVRPRWVPTISHPSELGNTACRATE